MPRKKRLRKVVAPPRFQGYKPYGSRLEGNGSVDLLYEEYEAIKLADYDLMNHNEAAVLMGVSRPTFARIYESARRKIAVALVETKEIKSVFGNAELQDNWFLCTSCEAKFNKPESVISEDCPICKSSKIKLLQAE
ncbi:DUF134 domain-containing protein [Labilibacter marinus]|uniref:DUF134 domain-containing protein n=1 Tax=Labilibacter marinus TaxID=1477105 RepID=UPI00094F94E6|nr:DUF134 domain-containing protein [Labilibacter marinus]